GSTRAGITNLFRFEEVDGAWRAVWDGSHDIPYEEIPASDVDGQGALPSVPTRRIVEHTSTRYRSDDLSKHLPQGALESLALPGESYHLALTPSDVARIFGALVTEATLTEGGYVGLDGSGAFWIPSGRVFYSAGDGDTPAQ